MVRKKRRVLSWTRPGFRTTDIRRARRFGRLFLNGARLCSWDPHWQFAIIETRPVRKKGRMRTEKVWVDTVCVDPRIIKNVMEYVELRRPGGGYESV